MFPKDKNHVFKVLTFCILLCESLESYLDAVLHSWARTYFMLLVFTSGSQILWVIEYPRELTKKCNFLGPVSRESDLIDLR